MRSIDVNVNSIFFQSYAVDPISQTPVYVFDSTYLPSFKLVDDKEVYDMLVNSLMDKLLTKLPNEPFSLVVFSSGFTTNDISWVYGIKMYAKVPKQVRALIQKTIIVHESFFVKTVFQVLKNAMSIKYLNSKEVTDTVIHVPSITTLASELDITRIRISLNVYLYDYQFNEKIQIPDEYIVDETSLANRQYRQLIFDRIFRRLKVEGLQSELVFQKPGSYKTINILLDLIERNHYVDLSQWDIYCLGSVFLNFLKNKSKPLIPIECIPLPVTDDIDYTKTTFNAIIAENGYYDILRTIFPLFIDILKNTDQTKHTLKTLSKSLTATLCKEKVSMKSGDRLAIGNRYIRNLLTHFYSIIDELDSKNAPALPARIVSGRPLTIPDVPKPRKSSPTRYALSLSSSQPPASEKSPSRSPSIDSLPSSVGKKEISSNQINIRLSANTILTPPAASVIKSSSSSSNSASSRNSFNNTLISPSKVLAKDIITDAEDTQLGEIIGLDEVMERLTLEKNSKIQTFDKELKKKKLQQQNSANASRFSNEGYSDISKGSKVSKLAALYEERLQGLCAINELK